MQFYIRLSHKFIHKKNISMEETHRAKPQLVNDDHAKLRSEIYKKSNLIQDHLHFEAAFRPHQKKLQDEIDEHFKRIEDAEKTLKEFNEKVETEKERLQKQNFQSPLDYVTDIDKLEKRLKKLLAEKYKYLEKIKESGIDMQSLL